MKRAPIVLTSTACGVVALVSYHAAAPHASALTGSAAGTLNLSSGNASSAKAGAKAASTTRATPSSATAATSDSASMASTASPTRTAVGSDVQYPYGDIELKVTMTGTKLVDVSVVRHDVTDPRSQMIDQIAVPQLRSQALQVQSARIDGISGASYTSAAYAQSLQSAIDKLKV